MSENGQDEQLTWAQPPQLNQGPAEEQLNLTAPENLGGQAGFLSVPPAGGGVQRVFVPLVTRCPQCDGEIAADGYCAQCGAKAPSQRDHYEIDLGAMAGVSDLGMRHENNEDAFAISTSAQLNVLVVADGVSTAANSADAALAAANAVSQFWQQKAGDNPMGFAAGLTEPAGASGELLGAQLVAMGDAAMQLANQQVISYAQPGEANPPSCTMAVALVDKQRIISLNLGDSRVYWLPDAGEPLLLSVDHSFAQENIELGMARAEAENRPDSHVITRWLGVDAPNLQPAVAAAQLTGAGWVLVCSDGLWNYASGPEQLAEVVHRLALLDASPIELAKQLVAWANSCGGIDNVTVALLRVDQPEGADMQLGTPTVALRPAR